MNENKWWKYGPWYEEVNTDKEGEPRERRLNLGTVTDIELAKAIMNACRQYALQTGLDHLAMYTLKLQEEFRPWIEKVMKEQPQPAVGEIPQPDEGCPCPQCTALRQQKKQTNGQSGPGGHYL